MSYTALAAAFEDGVLHGEHEFGNSHGFAPFVWDTLVRKYEIGADNLGRWPGGFPPMDAPVQLWAHHKEGKRLTHWEKNALEATYDNTVVKREDMLVVAASFRRFKDALWNGRRVCSLDEQAKAIEELHERGALFIAWYATSVSDCWYSVHDGSSNMDERTAYNIRTGTKHRMAPIFALELP